MTKCRHLTIKALGLVLLCANSAGCKRRPTESQLKLVHGIEDGEGKFPDVVSLVGKSGRSICTGTAIGRRAVLTAAHCISHTETLTAGPAAAARALVAKSYDGDLGVGDLAVLLFESDLPQPLRRLSFAKPPEQGTLTIVGYGCASPGQRDTVATRRYGTNILRSFDDTGPIGYVREDEESAPLGTDVSSCAGDSGGPVHVDGALIAVTSGNDGRYNFSTWIGTESARSLLRRANALGGAISGLPAGTDPRADEAAVRQFDY